MKDARRLFNFEPMQQPNGWTCGATVMAMVVGKGLRDVFDFFGHDGSTAHHIDSNNYKVCGKKRRGYNDLELITYLLARGYHCGTIYCHEDGYRFDSGEFDTPAALIVGSTYDGEACHYVLWDGKWVIDPIDGDFHEVGGYKVISWMQLQKLDCPVDRDRVIGRINLLEE